MQTLPVFVFGVIAVFLFGTIIGSFLNVFALRYNTGYSLRGRSQCLSCKIQLTWVDLVPVFSFFLLRGRCNMCKSMLSIQYPLVEVLTGLLFVALLIKSHSILTFFCLAFIFSIYVVIGVYDIRHSIVPNGLAYVAAFFAFTLLFLDTTTFSVSIPTLVELFSGPIVASPLFFLWLFSGGTWMGLGDAKLTLSIGWLLGVSGGSVALLVSFWTGAIFGLGVLLIHYLNIIKKSKKAGKSSLPAGSKRHTIKHEIPFAPFLLIGFFIVFFFDLTIAQLIL